MALLELDQAPRWPCCSALLFVQSAPAQAIQYERPVEAAPQEKDIGGGYVTPAVQKPLPRDFWLQVLDVVLLAAAMGDLGLDRPCGGAAGTGWSR